MNPKLRGVTSALDRLNHKFDKRADDLLAKVPDVEKRGDAAFDRAHQHLDAKVAEFAEVEQFVDGLEATVGNGGPMLDGSKEPLPDSQVTTGQGEQKAEPGASWAGKTG